MSIVQILIVAFVAVIAVGAVLYYLRQRRSAQLRSKFGSEYARAVEDSGGADKAEHALQEREKRVERYDLKPLSPDDRRRFGQEWERIQGLFVDDPTDATAQADGVIGEVMSARGYPDGPFERRLEDLSVDHPEAVQGYRVTHEVALTQGKASTEDMRLAMLNYRELFDELLGKAGEAPETVTTEPVAPESVAPESVAPESVAPESVATESVTVEPTTAEHETPENETAEIATTGGAQAAS